MFCSVWNADVQHKTWDSLGGGGRLRCCICTWGYPLLVPGVLVNFEVQHCDGSSFHGGHKALQGKMPPRSISSNKHFCRCYFAAFVTCSPHSLKKKQWKLSCSRWFLCSVGREDISWIYLQKTTQHARVLRFPSHRGGELPDINPGDWQKSFLLTVAHAALFPSPKAVFHCPAEPWVDLGTLLQKSESIRFLHNRALNCNVILLKTSSLTNASEIAWAPLCRGGK